MTSAEFRPWPIPMILSELPSCPKRRPPGTDRPLPPSPAPREGTGLPCWVSRLAIAPGTPVNGPTCLSGGRAGTRLLRRPGPLQGALHRLEKRHLSGPEGNRFRRVLPGAFRLGEAPAPRRRGALSLRRLRNAQLVRQPRPGPAPRPDQQDGTGSTKCWFLHERQRATTTAGLRMPVFPALRKPGTLFDRPKSREYEDSTLGGERI